MKYEPSLLLTDSPELAAASGVLVGLSGGLDSVVLLDSLVMLRRQGALRCRLAALHVNHGLSPNAPDWEAFCRAVCRRLDVDLQLAHADVVVRGGESPEACARKVRYREFQARLRAGELLVLGHHLDDQMETFLLHLLRGSGPKGLAGMPEARCLGRGSLARPLLRWRRQDLLEYATARELGWVVDESNEQLDFDRNYLRHRLLPVIEQRWPDYRESWRRSMSLSREAEQLLRELAGQDMERATTHDRRIIKLPPLACLSDARVRNLLRHWFDSVAYPAAGWHLLRRVTSELVRSRNPSARVENPAGPVLRYRGCLYLLAPEQQWKPESLTWQPAREPTLLLPGNGNLSADLPASESLWAAKARLHVRYRVGGERMRLPGRPTKALKALLQEAGVPPWLRERLPLLYEGDELVCIPAVGNQVASIAVSGWAGRGVTWQPPDLLYPGAELAGTGLDAESS